MTAICINTGLLGPAKQDTTEKTGLLADSEDQLDRAIKSAADSWTGKAVHARTGGGGGGGGVSGMFLDNLTINSHQQDLQHLLINALRQGLVRGGHAAAGPEVRVQLHHWIGAMAEKSAWALVGSRARCMS